MNEMLEKLGQNAKYAETVLRNLSTNDKNKTLEAVASALVNNTEEIAKNSDSVMIARGCLAVTVGIEKMTKAQDQSIKICKGCNTDVCVASNILRSLNNRNWPLRSDICA